MGNNTPKPIDPRFLRPSGLYPAQQVKWDLRIIRKLIQDKQVAPFFQGAPEPTSADDEECPICMLYYSGGLNRSACCAYSVCTECYFSVKPPPPAVTSVQCPFCQRPDYIVRFSGPLSAEKRKKLQDEEKKVKELEAKMRQEEIERDRQRELAKKAARNTADDAAKLTPEKSASVSTSPQHTPLAVKPMSTPRSASLPPPNNNYSPQQPQPQQQPQPNTQPQPQTPPHTIPQPPHPPQPPQPLIPAEYLGDTDDTDDDELLRQAIALSLEEASKNN